MTTYKIIEQPHNREGYVMATILQDGVAVWQGTYIDACDYVKSKMVTGDILEELYMNGNSSRLSHDELLIHWQLVEMSDSRLYDTPRYKQLEKRLRR